MVTMVRAVWDREFCTPNPAAVSVQAPCDVCVFMLICTVVIFNCNKIAISCCRNVRYKIYFEILVFYVVLFPQLH